MLRVAATRLCSAAAVGRSGAALAVAGVAPQRLLATEVGAKGAGDVKKAEGAHHHEVTLIGSKGYSRGYHGETPEEFEGRIFTFLARDDLDGWDVRQVLLTIQHKDMIPHPKLCTAVLRACRRVNDLALCIRFLEAVKIKCGNFEKTVYPYIIKEIQPLLDELGIPTPEELNYDKPELFTPEPAWYWDHSWYKQYGYDKNPRYEF